MDEGYSNPPMILAVFAHDNEFDYEKAFDNEHHIINKINSNFKQVSSLFS